MKKYLAAALLAVGLIMNVQAQTYTRPVTYTRVVSVPDSGSTAMLLGIGLAALALATRRRRPAAR